MADKRTTDCDELLGISRYQSRKFSYRRCFVLYFISHLLRRLLYCRTRAVGSLNACSGKLTSNVSTTANWLSSFSKIIPIEVPPPTITAAVFRQ